MLYRTLFAVVLSVFATGAAAAEFQCVAEVETDLADKVGAMVKIADERQTDVNRIVHERLLLPATRLRAQWPARSGPSRKPNENQELRRLILRRRRLLPGRFEPLLRSVKTYP